MSYRQATAFGTAPTPVFWAPHEVQTALLLHMCVWGGLGIACVCSLVGGSDSESPKARPTGSANHYTILRTQVQSLAVHEQGAPAHVWDLSPGGAEAGGVL